MRRADTLPILGPIAVLSLFAASCTLTAGYYNGKFLEDGSTPPGWWLLATGWVMIPFIGAPALAWFANPALGASLVCHWRRKFGAAAVWSGIAVGLSLLPPLALLPDSWPGEVRLWPDPAWVFRNLNDSRTEFRVGYFAWVGSHLLMLGIAGVCGYQCRRGKMPKGHDKRELKIST